jgi:hypothetical protein
MMILLVGGGKIGLASMLPNILPIMVILAVMGGARIPMDMVSILIGSIGIGLVVDDTVHFIYNLIGVVVIYGTPILRELPVKAARTLSVLAQKNKLYVAGYMSLLFIIIPLFLIGSSEFLL